MTKPKIALLTLRNSYNYGGVLSSVKVVYDFCLEYFEPTVFFLGFDSDVATSIKKGIFSSSTRHLSYFGMNCIEVGARWAFWEPGHYTYTVKQWQRALEGYDYFFMVSGTTIAAHPLALLDKKFIMWVSTLYDDDRARRVADLKGFRKLIDACAHPLMLRIEQKVLRQATVVFPLSSYSEKKFCSVVSGIENKMLPCGFPINLPDNISEVRNEKIVISVGRFSDPRKNFPMLLRMFKQVYNADDQARLFIVGMKPLRKDYEHHLELPYMKNITFTGQVSDADLHSLYRRASIMVISSYQEGFGIVGIEALSHGVPVIATDCGGTVDYTLDGITGYRVAVDDDETMARYVIEILRNEQLHNTLSKRAREFIKKQYAYPAIHKLFKKGLVKAYPDLAPLLRKNRMQEKRLSSFHEAAL